MWKMGQDAIPDNKLMLPFLDWVKQQPDQIFMQVLMHVETINAVLSDHDMVIGTDFVAPNYWEMADASLALKQIAQEAGFSDAAQYCQYTYEQALLGIKMIEELLDS
jgi:hypothetical protein